MDNPIHTLKEKLPSLTNSQRNVANFILENPIEVSFYTVDQLAKKANTSTATIMRMATTLGYKGYSEFQKSLQANTRFQSAPKTRFEANLLMQDKKSLWDDCMTHHINNIQHIYQLISHEHLESVFDLLVSSKNIYFTSVRSGMPVAQHLYHGLNRILGNCHLIPADKIEWVDELIDFKKDSLVVAISFPRYSNRIIELMTLAKERNAKILSITDSYSSPLVKYSDIVLPCTSSSLSYHNSIVTSILIADYLITAIANKYPEKTKQRLEQLNKVLTSVNYHYS